MKKFYMTMAAMLCGVAAMAQTNELYVEDVTLNAGESTQVAVCLRNEQPISIIGFKFDTAPTGVTLAKKAADLSFNEDRLDMETARIAAEDDEAEAADLFKFNYKKGAVTFGADIPGYRDDNQNWVSVCFLGTDGPVIYFPLTVAEGVEDGVYEITLKNVSLGDDSYVTQSVASSDVCKFNLNVGGTGINSIKANDANAPIYNVAGQRVSKAQKGVYIQNGKKVAVK